MTARKRKRGRRKMVEKRIRRRKGEVWRRRERE